MENLALSLFVIHFSWENLRVSPTLAQQPTYADVDHSMLAAYQMARALKTAGPCQMGNH